MLPHINAIGDPQGRGRVLLDDQDRGAVFPGKTGKGYLRRSLNETIP